MHARTCACACTQASECNTPGLEFAGKITAVDYGDATECSTLKVGDRVVSITQCYLAAAAAAAAADGGSAVHDHVAVDAAFFQAGAAAPLLLLLLAVVCMP